MAVQQGDPIAVGTRRAKAARRVGAGARCAGCGEDRPEALIARTKPTRCTECQRKVELRSTFDKHHVAGKRNGSSTVPVPVNDHRAELSEAQHAWPRRTLENPDGSPFLAAAAHVRGLIDEMNYLIEKCLLWIPELLEWLDNLLRDHLGASWWLRHELPIPDAIQRSLRRG